MDPKAKIYKAAKRYGRALGLIRQGAQLNQWSVKKVEEDTEVYLVGKPEMVQYIKELLDEVIREETTATRPANSLELGAGKADDNQASHAETPLQEEGASGDSSEPEQNVDATAEQGSQSS